MMGVCFQMGRYGPLTNRSILQGQDARVAQNFDSDG